MSELPTSGPKEQLIFEQETVFEINDVVFNKIQITADRIKGIGIKWTRFELLLSFIGAAWLEKWRRFGMELLGAGIAVIVLSFGFMMIENSPSNSSILGFLFMILGLAIVSIWALVKKEALLLFTPGGMFKIEGSLDFVESLWNVISPKLE